MFQYFYFEKIDISDRQVLLDTLKQHITIEEQEMMYHDHIIVFYASNMDFIKNLMQDIFSETMMKTKVYISPHMSKANILHHLREFETIKFTIQSIPNQVISNLDLLKYLSKRDSITLKKFIFGKYLNHQTFLETLKTYFVLNQNAIASSKMLFLHRNTLLQRLETFESYTSLNPKNFIDAHFIYSVLF